MIKYWFNNNHKYILIDHSAHLSKNLIKYPKWLNIIIESQKRHTLIPNQSTNLTIK